MHNLRLLKNLRQAAEGLSTQMIKTLNCPPLTIVRLKELIQVSDSMKSLTCNPVIDLHCPQKINISV